MSRPTDRDEVEPWNTLVTSGVITPYKWGEITPVTHLFSAIHRPYNSIITGFLPIFYVSNNQGFVHRLKLQTFPCFGTSMPKFGTKLVENVVSVGYFSSPRSCISPLRFTWNKDLALRIQVSPKEGISPIQSYSGDGIGTLNPILGRCLDS